MWGSTDTSVTTTLRAESRGVIPSACYLLLMLWLGMLPKQEAESTYPHLEDLAKANYSQITAVS